MSTFTFTAQANAQPLSPILRGRYTASIDQTPTTSWAELAGTPAIPSGGLALAIDATEALRVAIKPAALAGGDPLEGYNYPAGARDVLFVAAGDVICIRTP